MTPELIIAIEVCLQAGKSILRHDFCHVPASVGEFEAGLEAFKLIAHTLSVTGLPVVGAYSEEVPFEVRSGWRQFWLVAPVEGEFESLETAECTVSIALIEHHEPVLGVVYAPATDELYCASRETGAYRVRHASSAFVEITRLHPPSRRTAVPVSRTNRLLVNRAHLDERMLGYIEDLGSEHPKIELVQRGGTLNFCLVAAGDAELYPRIDSTCEWDTAAGHAILKAAGRNVVDMSTGRELSYNKPEMVNPFFLAQ